MRRPLLIEASARALWLLEVHAGTAEGWPWDDAPPLGPGGAGRWLRWSTEPVEVTDGRTGLTVRFDAGLDDLSADDDGADVTVHDGMDWPVEFSRGLRIERARAALRRWRPGQRLEEAEVVVRGAVSGLSHGARGEPVSFRVAPRPREGSETLPPPQAVVDSSTWPKLVGYTTDEKVLGAYYPRVYGSPGLGDRAATPALLVQHGAAAASTFLLIAGHATAHDVHVSGRATTVTISDYSDDPPTSESRTVHTTTDLLGRTVDYVDFAGSALTRALGREYWCSWSETGGGLIGRSGAPVRGGGEVLIDLARHVEGPWDVARMEAQRSVLDAYRLDFALLAAADAAEILDEVAALLPVTLTHSDDGVYYRAWRWRATRADVTFRLDARRDRLSRSGPLDYLDIDPHWEFVAEFAPDRGGDAYTDRRVLSAVADPADPRVLVSRRCVLARDRYGRPGAGARRVSLSLPYVWDAATAVLVLRDREILDTVQRRRQAYDGGGDLSTLAEGDVGTLTDVDLALDDELCLVESIDADGQRTTVALVLLDDPDAGRTRRIA